MSIYFLTHSQWYWDMQRVFDLHYKITNLPQTVLCQGFAVPASDTQPIKNASESSLKQLKKKTQQQYAFPKKVILTLNNLISSKPTLLGRYSKDFQWPE